MKKIIIGMLAVAMSGCAAEHSKDNLFTPAQRTYTKPSLVTVPKSATQYQFSYGNDPKLERAFHQYMRSGKAPNIVTDGFVKFAYSTGQQPIVETSPFQETVISLEPGEKFTNVTSGDPSRWSYSAAVSGTGASQQQNILVKPSQPELSTNMVITTDRRIYNIKLVSSMDTKSTKSVSFWYPDEMVQSINNSTLKAENDGTIASVPDVSLNNLNFKYGISSDGFFKSMPSWKPTRVFDDGTHTYIQFADDISNKDMPALFVQNNGANELVNYRYKAPYFVVDKIFKRAVLVMGVGYSQSKVVINNYCYS